jgi:hypothetical protein
VPIIVLITLASGILLTTSCHGVAPPEPSGYVVGAYYFGVWADDSDHWSLRAGRDTYGRTDVWAGVRDFHGDFEHHPPVARDTRGWGGDFSHLKPAIGYYDLRDRSVIERHIRQASSHGLSFFSFYWYWDTTSKTEHLQRGLAAYLEAANRSELDFMLSIVAHGYDPRFNIPVHDFATVADTLASRYLGHPDAVRTRAGRPLIFIEDSKGIGDGSAQHIDHFVRTLREHCAAHGVDPFVLINPEVGPVVDRISGADGYSCLTLANLALPNDGHGDVGPVGSYERYLDRLGFYFTTWYRDRPFMRCFASHIDHRPRTDLGHIRREELPYLTDWSIDAFRRGLEQLREIVDDSRDGELQGYVDIYSWNDWKECGFPLEPSEAHGSRSLEIVADVFDLPVSGCEGCRVLGSCQGRGCSGLSAAER